MINNALIFAARVHEGQKRKGTDIPYITHPYAVGLMLSQAGCSETVIAAGFLHDTVEDGEGITISDIRSEFGEDIAAIVKACSEPDKSWCWEKRKQHTVELLAHAPLAVRQVACADKLHNLHSIALDLASCGEEVWRRFKRGKDKQEWYYRSLVASFCSSSAEAECEIPHLAQLRQEVQAVFGTKDESTK